MHKKPKMLVILSRAFGHFVVTAGAELRAHSEKGAGKSLLFFPTCRVRVVRFDQSSSPPPPPVLLLLRGSTGASGHRTGWSTLLRWTSNLVKWKGASERFWSCRLLINKPSHLDVKLMFCCLITIMSTPD